MRQFKFEPVFYEWHLIDNATEEVLHNMVEPSDLLVGYRTVGEVENLCREELISADISYSEKLDYNGVLLDNSNRLDQIEEIPIAAKLMADVLYNYYIK